MNTHVCITVGLAECVAGRKRFWDAAEVKSVGSSVRIWSSLSFLYVFFYVILNAA